MADNMQQQQQQRQPCQVEVSVLDITKVGREVVVGACWGAEVCGQCAAAAAAAATCRPRRTSPSWVAGCLFKAGV
jgi:hypothetical protein